MANDRFLSLLGLATKAGKVASGEYMTEKSVKEGKAFLVVVAEDSSDNTKKNFKDMCAFYEIPYKEYGIKESLGKAIGKEFRASCAVLDEGFARSLVGMN